MLKYYIGISYICDIWRFLLKRHTKIFYLVSLGINLCWAAYAAPLGTATTNDRLDNMRRQAEEQQSQIDAPWVQTQIQSNSKTKVQLPVEKDGLYIRQIHLDKSGYERFAWLEELLQSYTEREIGLQGVNTLAKHISEELIGAGYITTKVVVPEQDLTSGILRFRIIPGTISAIDFDSPDIRGSRYQPIRQHHHQRRH